MAKRKRNYGSPPEVHQQRANEAFAFGMRATENANVAINDGRCDRAATALSGANEAAGAAAANVQGMEMDSRSSTGSGPMRAIDNLRQKIGSAERRFAEKCLK